MVAHSDLELEHMDVKTEFLHGDLEETIYMELHEGYLDNVNRDNVCLLRKSLYDRK